MKFKALRINYYARVEETVIKGKLQKVQFVQSDRASKAPTFKIPGDP